jgi:hypothetical protein
MRQPAKHSAAAAWKCRERAAPIFIDHPSPTNAGRNHAADRSGTNPDDRNRNRDTQTKRTENRQNELGKQTHAVSYAR